MEGVSRSKKTQFTEKVSNKGGGQRKRIIIRKNNMPDIGTSRSQNKDTQFILEKY